MESKSANSIKVGDRVRYIHEDTQEDKVWGVYPPKETLGTVISTDGTGCVLVCWDEGTKYDGKWYCDKHRLEIVSIKPASKEVIEKALDMALKELSDIFGVCTVRDKEYWKEKARRVIENEKK